MWGEKVKWLLLLLILTPCVWSLGVSPNETSVEIPLGQGRIITYSIFNNNTIPITDVMLDLPIPESTYTPLSRLEPYQIAQFNLTINKSAISTSAYLRKFIYSEMRLYNISPQTKQINITSSGFSTNPLNIIPQDTVLWTNTDSIPHTVTCQYFDQTLAPNASFSYTFNSQNVGLVYDRINTYSQAINYLNQTQVNYWRNPDNDVAIKLTIASLLENTRLILAILDPPTHNVTVEVGNSTQGILRITNPTSQTAINVTLKADYITFGRQTFNVEPNTPQFINFVIAPPINQSNLTYHIIFTASGLNVNEGSEYLDIFAPYKPIDQQALRLNRSLEILAQIRELCQILPDSPICKQEPVIRENNVTILVDRPVQINYTQDQMNELWRNYITLTEDNRVATNQIKETNELTRQQIENMSGKFNNVGDTVDLLREEVKNTRTGFWMMLILFIILVVGVGFYYVGQHIYKRTEMMRGTKT